MEKAINQFYTWLSPRLRRICFVVFIYDYSLPRPGFLIHLKSNFACCHFVTGEVKIVRVLKQLRTMNAISISFFHHVLDPQQVFFQNTQHLLNVFCVPGTLQDTYLPTHQLCFQWRGTINYVKPLRFSSLLLLANYFYFILMIICFICHLIANYKNLCLFLNIYFTWPYIWRAVLSVFQELLCVSHVVGIQKPSALCLNLASVHRHSCHYIFCQKYRKAQDTVVMSEVFSYTDLGSALSAFWEPSGLGCVVHPLRNTISLSKMCS